MTTNEIMMIIIICFLFGYWIIDAIMGKKKPPSADNTNDKARSDDSGNQEASGSQQSQRAKDKPFSENQPQAWHEVLAVSRSASLEEVKTAYRSLIRQYHPDKVATLGQELRELAERKSKVINQAYSDALLAVGNRK